jgi:hypothetical protein
MNGLLKPLKFLFFVYYINTHQNHHLNLNNKEVYKIKKIVILLLI